MQKGARRISSSAQHDSQLNDDFEYAPEELDRSVQTPDQIRTIARTLRDNWKRDLFPQRQELPKTLVFAKSLPRTRSGDHKHAEAIVGIPREEWGRDNEFAQESNSLQRRRSARACSVLHRSQ